MAANMLVSMILRLVDEMTGPMKAAEAEVKHFEKTTADASRASANANRMSAAEFRALTEGKKVAANNSAAAVERMSAAEFRAMSAAKDHATQAATAQREHAEAVASTSSAFSGLATQIVGLAAAYDTLKVAHKAFEAGVAGQHSKLAMETAGINALDPHAIKDIQDTAKAYSETYKMFAQTNIEHMIADARLFTGSLEHGKEIMGDLLDLRTIQQARYGHSTDEEFGSLAQALELSGRAGDREKSHEFLDAVGKIMLAYGDQIKPSFFQEMYKQLGNMRRTLDLEFLMGAGAHLGKMMGPGALGNALNMFSRMTEAGTMQPKAMEMMDKIGLLDQSKVRRKSNGEIRWIDATAVKDWEVAMRRPDLWAWNTLGPALDKAKITGDERAAFLTAMTSNASVGKVLDALISNRGVILNDRENVGNTMDPHAAAAKWMQEDVNTAFAGVGAQLENFGRHATESFAPAVAAFANSVSSLIAFHNKNTSDATKTAELGGLLAGGSLASIWALIKSPALLRRWITGGAGGAAGAAAETGGTIASTEVAAATIGSRIVPLFARLLGPLGIAYGLYEASNHPVATGDLEDRQKGLADLTRRWGVRPDQATRRATSGMDTGEMDEARRKADETGQAIVTSLSVTARPTVDKSDLREVEAILDRIAGRLAGLGAGFAGLTAGANRLRTSAGALHDGPETGGR